MRQFVLLPLLILLPISSLLLVHSSPLSPEPLPPDWPIWLAIERVLPSPEGEGDAVLVRPELCNRPCAELLGEGAEQIHRARCVCRCPPGQPAFIQQKMGGKCAQKVQDCPGRPIFFEHPQNARPQFVPAISLPQRGDPLGGDLRIAWKESGVKVRQSQGPRCAIRSAALLGNESEWRPLDGPKLFEPGWAEGNGRVLWLGDDLDGQQLAGAIVRLELDCVAGKSGNATFCLSFRVEGQIEAPRGVGKAPPGAVGMELERGRRAEVVVIILLAILLFLSLFGSLFLWNVCWRVHKRKLVHSLQMQFLHYARQEKEKAISECQLRYQALVKAAAGMRNADGGSGQGPSTGNGPILMENGMMMMVGGGGGGGGGEGGGGEDAAGGQQQNGAGRRKLYFSSEFFEPQLMSNPPPMAEQFLYDLRRMISVARERIRTRRHVPRLAPVVESEDEAAGGGGTIGKMAKSGKGGQEEKTNENDVVVDTKMEEEVEEGRKEAKREGELALSMEEIVREQQQRRGSQGDQKEGGEGEAEEGGETEENSSPRSSMDSGRGSEKQEEEGEMEGRKGGEAVMEEKANEEMEQMEEKNEEEEGRKKGEEKGEDEKRNGQREEHSLEPASGQMSSTSTSIQTSPSRIPVGTASTSKSPRLPFKFTALCRRPPPPLPPRPPPPPPSGSIGGTEREGRPQKTAQGQNPLAAVKRRIAGVSNNGEKEKATTMASAGGGGGGKPSSLPSLIQQGANSYAVCPPPSFACSDRMKKSLPRRKKAIVPQPIGMPPNSAVLQKTAPTAV